jgi:hypothetical protein
MICSMTKMENEMLCFFLCNKPEHTLLAQALSFSYARCYDAIRCGYSYCCRLGRHVVCKPPDSCVLANVLLAMYDDLAALDINVLIFRFRACSLEVRNILRSPDNKNRRNRGNVILRCCPCSINFQYYAQKCWQGYSNHRLRQQLE